MRTRSGGRRTSWPSWRRHATSRHRRAVRQARKAGDLDARLAEARGKLARAEKKAAVALAQLPSWSGSADQLERLAVPLNATLDQYESRFQEITRLMQALAERRATVADAIRQFESRLQSLELESEVPTEEALLAARNRREQGWRLIKSAWLEGRSQGDLLAAFLADFAPGTGLDSAYEQSVQRGDVLSDRLRREADRVARVAEWISQLDQHRALHAALETEGRQLDSRAATLEKEWHALTCPLGVETPAQSPAELRAWLRRREEVLLLLEKWEEARQCVEPLEHDLSRHRTAVSQALEHLGESFSASDHELADLLELAEAMIKRADELAQKRSRRETKLVAVRTERATAELSLQAAGTALADWQTEWSVMMGRIGLEADAAPEQAEVFLTRLGDLEENLGKRREFQSRIRGIDRDADEFARDVAALAQRVAPDLVDRPAGESARELTAHLRNAQAEAQQRAALALQRDRAEASRRASEMLREEARVCLERLCQEAGCTEFDQLPEAARRSQDHARLESDLAACEEQLILAAAGTDLLTFATEVEQADPEALDASIEESESRIAADEAELQRVDQAIGAERGELARMDGSDRAAEAAVKAQTLLAQLQGEVARYATLKLAAAVLHRGIERYREKYQGPILARASAVFAALTGGSFARLQIDDNGDGQSTLKGVRPDGKLIGVEGMSDGSHDQLYLALRLASLDSWLQSHEPVPFIVDDILLNFDDRRATAALEALADLSRRTQVLFFTHHRHIINLARTHLPAEVVFIHELPGPRGQPA
jgi:hypothetical protein